MSSDILIECINILTFGILLIFDMLIYMGWCRIWRFFLTHLLLTVVGGTRNPSLFFPSV